MVTRVRARQVCGQFVRRRQAGRSFTRLALTVFVLLTFAVQGYVTQTHIHLPGESDLSFVSSDLFVAPAHAKVVASPNGDRHDFPAKDDPANCPLCQQISLAGAFVTPTVTVLYIPAELGSLAPPARAVVTTTIRASHNWQGRAPPTL
jgi:hypothetical protein